MAAQSESLGSADMDTHWFESFYKTPGSSQAFILIRSAADSHRARDNNSVSKKTRMTHKDKEHKQQAAAKPLGQLETQMITHTHKVTRLIYSFSFS